MSHFSRSRFAIFAVGAALLGVAGCATGGTRSQQLADWQGRRKNPDGRYDMNSKFGYNYTCYRTCSTIDGFTDEGCVRDCTEDQTRILE